MDGNFRSHCYGYALLRIVVLKRTVKNMIKPNEMTLQEAQALLYLFLWFLEIQINDVFPYCHDKYTKK